MNTRPLLTLRLAVGELQNLGVTPEGTRTIFPITGGVVEGDRVHGKVLPGGSDWALQRTDGATTLDLRITVETDDGALVYTTFTGLKRGDYFHTVFRFETAAPQYAFLNGIFGVGTGSLQNGQPVHVVEELL